jgi:hypothetical protein
MGRVIQRSQKESMSWRMIKKKKKKKGERKNEI